MVSIQARPQQRPQIETAAPQLRGGIVPSFSTLIGKVATIAGAIFSFALLPAPLNLIFGGILTIITLLPWQSSNNNGANVNHWYHNFSPNNWLPTFNSGWGGGTFAGRTHRVSTPFVNTRPGPQAGFRAQPGVDATQRFAQPRQPQTHHHRGVVGGAFPTVRRQAQGPQAGSRAQPGVDATQRFAPPTVVPPPRPQTHQVGGFGAQGGQRASIGSD